MDFATIQDHAAGADGGEDQRLPHGLVRDLDEALRIAGVLYRPLISPRPSGEYVGIDVEMMKQMGDAQPSEKELKRIEAIIDSMTRGERANHTIINGSRRLRIAKGSGTSVQEVNQLLKRFTEAQKVIKQLQKLGPKGLMKGLGGMKGMLPF